MGSIVGKTMDENFKKNQEFMIASQRAQVERQMHMQNAMREQQMAIQVARSRDLFQWWAAFYATYAVIAVARTKKTGNRAIIAPLLPFTFIVAYLGDMAYGTKMIRIKDEAKSILTTETHLLDLPVPMPTLEDLDKRREANHK